jgi:hypothetical protein
VKVRKSRAYKEIKHLESGDTVPRVLFRYRALHDRFDSVKKILLHNLWYLGSRKDFDDQKDMVLPGVVLDREHLRELAIRKNGNLTADIESQIEQFLADPKAEQRTVAEIQNDLDDVGILCLSEEANNPKLWKLYADDGEGICLMLESLGIFPAASSGPIYGPFDVKYSDDDKRPFDPRHDQLAQTEDHLLRKTQQWAYQKEWRFIRFRYGKHSTVGYYSLPPRSVLGLIFGCKLTSDERALIREWTRLGPFRPAFFEAKAKGGSIQLKAAPPE